MNPHYDRILAIAPDAILAIDSDHRIIMFNRSAEELFGYEAAAVMGQPLDRLLPDGMGHLHRSHVDTFSHSDAVARRMGERHGYRILGRRRNGEVFPAEASISKLEVDGHSSSRPSCGM